MKRNFFSNRKAQRRRGAAMVETAFVVIILLVLTLGLLQWGIIFNASISLTNLSREGARFAAVHYDENQPIEDYIKTNLPPGIKSGDLTITIKPAAADRKPREAIHVILDYNMSKKLFLPNKMFSEPYTITFFSGNYRSEGQMMMEE